jgi:hypothetical protein
MPWLGEKEFMQLEGEAGFLLALRRHAADLRTREWDWFDAVFVDEARQILGEQHISDVLDEVSATDEDIRPFVEFVRRESSQKSEAGSAAYRREITALTVDDIVTAAEAPRKTMISFRSWGRHATVADLGLVLSRMLNCDNVESLQRYLQVFARRPMPQFDSRLLELCQHENWQVRSRAATAAAINKHSEVRKFAMNKLAQHEYQHYAIEMLVKNYERGDEQAVLDAVVLPGDSSDRHSMLMSLLKMIEENPESERKRPAELIYDETPCSVCRHDAVKLLVERNLVSEQIHAECKFDVEPDTRTLVGGPAWNELAN